jgi:hypothetical protein
MNTPNAVDSQVATCAEIDARDKRFAILRAELARRGYQLHAIDAGNGTSGFLIARWDRSRELPDTDAVERFLEQLGK